MIKEYSTEQSWEMFEKLPEDLKEAVFSSGTAENIWDVCEKYDIDNVSLAAKIVGQVLMGFLAPNELQEVLTAELQINHEAAKEITREIGRIILYPVKASLQKIYGENNTPSESREKIETETIPKSSGPDDYRESVE
jgi:ATP-dependent RNA circularization protein (DNA/RNA ligase family)